MIILDNVVVTDEFLNAQFCCCLPRCKPAMLVHLLKPLK